MRRLLPPFIGCRSQLQKEETAHAQAIAAFYRLPQSAPEEGDGACAGYCRLCARRRTAHAQAIVASFRLSHSAPERTDGACARRYRRHSQAVIVIARRNKRLRLAQSDAARTGGVYACYCRLMKPGAVKGSKMPRRMRRLTVLYSFGILLLQLDS